MALVAVWSAALDTKMLHTILGDVNNATPNIQLKRTKNRNYYEKTKICVLVLFASFFFGYVYFIFIFIFPRFQFYFFCTAAAAFQKYM
jgi:Ca2+-dependent lipid-binding protein